MPEWEDLTSAQLEHARSATMLALSPSSDRPVAHRLAIFYDTATEYAGASFATLEPVTPDRVTAVDLFATTLLSVDIGPGALRRLTAPEMSRRITTLLGTLPTDLTLQDAEARHLANMAALYELVRPALSAVRTRSKNQWVPASKLLARKRPLLFPVRDNFVCDLIGAPKRYRVDWSLFRSLMRDRQVRAALAELPAAVAEEAERAGRDLALDTSELRLLDAALWTWSKSGVGAP